MKILGKNSLSSGVRLGLKLILAIVIILEIALIAFLYYNKSEYYRRAKKYNIVFIYDNSDTSCNSSIQFYKDF